ncbi:MAG: glycosyltransferase, partial [Gammaproteobacteria bacterium]|nr:glycosyltransferase [Gammaproteobacteria bacterium]
MTDSDHQGGSDNPLVSVIVRTTNRPLLTAALQSIVRQNYRPLEVILVDATGAGVEYEGENAVTGDLPVSLVSLGVPLPRARAANEGLSASNGQLLMFLDEDDWITPEHVTGLVETLQANPAFYAAYSTTRKADPQGNPLDERFASDYDPVLLKRDNYI